MMSETKKLNYFGPKANVEKKEEFSEENKKAILPF